MVTLAVFDLQTDGHKSAKSKKKDESSRKKDF